LISAPPRQLALPSRKPSRGRLRCLLAAPFQKPPPAAHSIGPTPRFTRPTSRARRRKTARCTTSVTAVIASPRVMQRRPAERQVAPVRETRRNGVASLDLNLEQRQPALGRDAGGHCARRRDRLIAAICGAGRSWSACHYISAAKAALNATVPDPTASCSAAVLSTLSRRETSFSERSGIASFPPTNTAYVTCVELEVALARLAHPMRSPCLVAFLSHRREPFHHPAPLCRRRWPLPS